MGTPPATSAGGNEEGALRPDVPRRKAPTVAGYRGDGEAPGTPRAGCHPNPHTRLRVRADCNGPACPHAIRLSPGGNEPTRPAPALALRFANTDPGVGRSRARVVIQWEVTVDQVVRQQALASPGAYGLPTIFEALAMGRPASDQKLLMELSNRVATDGPDAVIKDLGAGHNNPGPNPPHEDPPPQKTTPEGQPLKTSVGTKPRDFNPYPPGDDTLKTHTPRPDPKVPADHDQAVGNPADGNPADGSHPSQPDHGGQPSAGSGVDRDARPA